jgi:hypothetical protein
MLIREGSSHMSHYKTLGVSQGATDEDIKVAYRRKMRESHPDIPGGSTEKAAEVTYAYSILSNYTSKLDYDKTLAPKETTNVRTSAYSSQRHKQEDPAPFVPKYTATPNVSNRSQSDDTTTKVAPPIDFEPTLIKLGYKRSRFLDLVLATTLGKVVGVVSALSIIVSLTSFVVGLQEIESWSNGLAFTAGAMMVGSIASYLIKPLRHPWLFTISVILFVGIPLDHINGFQFLPNILEGLSLSAAVTIPGLGLSSEDVVPQLQWAEPRVESY